MLCGRIKSQQTPENADATFAKVGVEGSNPFARSSFFIPQNQLQPARLPTGRSAYSFISTFFAPFAMKSKTRSFTGSVPTLVPLCHWPTASTTTSPGL
ncbi:hypothetical protein A8950_1352 [Dongia mobilis]|uniref:Uncharacterized protein n=1 Tax=Dongia mobilis TaxID=578943 RepID=A0A4V3DET5_9PROT|nr:hypothetical protein A8950_1352 [Dongia mobilis]